MSTGASFPAWGGIATVAVSDPDALQAATGAVRETIDEFDRGCSRFRADSELSALNRGSGRPVRVGAALLDSAQAALHAAQLTAGAVDPTVGAALISLGYDRDFDEMLAGGPRPIRVRAVAAAGWRAVELDRERATIRLPRGVSLDLGATAKALAADRAAERASAAAGCGVLVSLSGDVAIAGEGPPEGWCVRVTDDHRAGPGAPGQTVTLRDGGLATSSTEVRRWQTTSGEVHHLLDPATGRPACGPWRTVSVAAQSCLGANIASTATVVRGEEAVAWLQELSLPARLVSQAAAVRHLGGWPAAGEDVPVGPTAVAA